MFPLFLFFSFFLLWIYYKCMYMHGMHVLDGLLCELNYENMNVLQVLNDVKVHATLL